MRFLSLLLLVALTTCCFAQAPKLPGAPCTSPPTIDGTIDPVTEWKDATTYDSFVDSQSGSPSSERTRMWLTYDKAFIYLAVKAEEPAQVHATEYRVNASLGSEDNVTFGIDFSGTMADFNYFSVNPLGATSVNLAGGRAVKREWMGEFVAMGRILAGGYEIEARIPWNLMNLGRAGKSDLRISLARFHQHSQLTDVMSFTQNNLVNNTPYWVGVDLPKERPPRTLKFLPYAYGGWDKSDGHISDAGLDMKMPVTDKVTLVGSINPDFKNIENQLLSLDFSRFERLAGEVRPFFLEGASYMGTALFASQRIARFDAGINTYGKIGDKTSFGLIDTWTAQREEDVVLNVTNNPTPTDQFRFSYAGQNRPDVKNDGYLARYYKTIGPYSIFGRTMGTKDMDNGFGASQYAAFSFNKNPWSYNVDYTYTDPWFTPRLGFVPEIDLKGPTFDLEYSNPFEHGPLAHAYLGGFYLDYRHADGSFYRTEGTLNGSAQHRATRLQLSGSVDWQDFEGERDRLIHANLFFPYNDAYKNLYVDYGYGTAATLPYKSLSFGGHYRTLRNKLDLSLSGQLVNYQGYADQIIFSASYDLGKDQSISGRLVKAADKIGPYIAYRRAGNRGAEYFLLIGNPNSEQFRTAIVLKVTVPFEVNVGKGK